MNLQARLWCLDHWSDWAPADRDTERTLGVADWVELRSGETVIRAGGLVEVALRPEPPAARADGPTTTADLALPS